MAVVRQKFMPHPATCPLSRPAGEGWGEGGSMGCSNLIFPQATKPSFLTFPRRTGEGTKLQLQQQVAWALPTKLGVCQFEG